MELRCAGIDVIANPGKSPWVLPYNKRTLTVKLEFTLYHHESRTHSSTSSSVNNTKEKHRGMRMKKSSACVFVGMTNVGMWA